MKVNKNKKCFFRLKGCQGDLTHSSNLNYNIFHFSPNLEINDKILERFGTEE